MNICILASRSVAVSRNLPPPSLLPRAVLVVKGLEVKHPVDYSDSGKVSLQDVAMLSIM